MNITTGSVNVAIKITDQDIENFMADLGHIESPDFEDFAFEGARKRSREETTTRTKLPNRPYEFISLSFF